MKTQSKIFSLVPSLIFAFLFIVISRTQAAKFITNGKTQTCLQYSVNSTQNCMPLTFTSCQFGNSSSDSTKWNLISVNPSRPLSSSSEIFIESFDNKLCLTTKSSSDVEACPCINDDVNQKWKFNVDGSFSSSSNDGKCLTVSDDNVVGLDTCQGKSTLMIRKTSDVAPNKSVTDTDDDDDDHDHHAAKGLKPWHIILIVILILLIILIIIIVAALLIRRSNIKKRQTKIDNFKEAYDENKVQKQMRNLYDIAPRLVKNNDYKISPLKKLEPTYSSKQAQLNRIQSNYSNNDSDNDNDDNEKNGAFFKRQKLRRSSTMGSVNRKARCYFENNNYDDFEIIVADKAIKTSPHTIFNEDYHTGGNDLS